MVHPQLHLGGLQSDVITIGKDSAVEFHCLLTNLVDSVTEVKPQPIKLPETFFRGRVEEVQCKHYRKDPKKRTQVAEYTTVIQRL